MTFREVLRSLLPDRGSEVVSAEWLKDFALRGDRRGYDGVTLRFPIRKLQDDAAGFNRYLLRKLA